MKSRSVLIVAAVVAVILVGCSSDGESGDTTTTTAASTTTTAAATTTTTTAAATTTTAAPASFAVPATPLIAALQPYSAGGADLFPTGSVEAHWYQWDGLYVVMYRGFDASDGSPICAGNSIQEATGFNFISNSPHNGTVDEICDGAPRIAEAPSGVYACGSLLYYLTEIPVETVGNLYGTLEIVDANGANGQTSAVSGVPEAAPEFEPGLDAYTLEPTTVDDGGTVTCS